MRRLLLLALLTLLVALPLSAQESSDSTLTYDGISFTVSDALATNINIVNDPGDPVDISAPGGPEPPYTQFILYNGAVPNESILDGIGGLRVYRIADMEDYDLSYEQVTGLQQLLDDRPDPASFYEITVQGANAQDSALPFLPVFPAAQVTRARAEYIDTDTLSGIRYITAYRQDASPMMNNDFRLTFQGITADGQHYVVAVFNLTTDLFSDTIPDDFDWEAFSENIDAHLNEVVATINGAAPENFTPSLTQLNAVIDSIRAE